jgi:hypothetical protein
LQATTTATAAAAAAAPSSQQLQQQQQPQRRKKRQRSTQQLHAATPQQHESDPAPAAAANPEQRAAKRRKHLLAHPEFWSHWKVQLQQLLQQPDVTQADCDRVVAAVRAAKVPGGRPNSFKALLAQLQARLADAKQQQQQGEGSEDADSEDSQVKNSQSEKAEQEEDEEQQHQQISSAVHAPNTPELHPSFWTAREKQLRQLLQQPLATGADLAAAQQAIHAGRVAGSKPKVVTDMLRMLEGHVQEFEERLQLQQLREQRHQQRQQQQREDPGQHRHRRQQQQQQQGRQVAEVTAPTLAPRSARPQFWADRAAELQQVLQQPLDNAEGMAAAEHALAAACTSGRRPPAVSLLIVQLQERVLQAQQQQQQQDGLKTADEQVQVEEEAEAHHEQQQQQRRRKRGRRLVNLQDVQLLSDGSAPAGIANKRPQTARREEAAAAAAADSVMGAAAMAAADAASSSIASSLLQLMQLQPAGPEVLDVVAAIEEHRLLLLDRLRQPGDSQLVISRRASDSDQAAVAGLTVLKDLTASLVNSNSSSSGDAGVQSHMLACLAASVPATAAAAGSSQADPRSVTVLSLLLECWQQELQLTTAAAAMSDGAGSSAAAEAAAEAAAAAGGQSSLSTYLTGTCQLALNVIRETCSLTAAAAATAAALGPASTNVAIQVVFGSALLLLRWPSRQDALHTHAADAAAAAAGASGSRLAVERSLHAALWRGRLQQALQQLQAFQASTQQQQQHNSRVVEHLVQQLHPGVTAEIHRLQRVLTVLA